MNTEQILTTGPQWAMQLTTTEFLAGLAVMAAAGFPAGAILGKSFKLIRGR